MKSLSRYIIFFALTCICFGQAYKIEGVKLRSTADSTFVQILTSKKPTFKKFSSEKPPKIGVDFSGGTYAIDQGEFKNLPAGIVKSIRGSQYQSEPNPVGRIVLDLSEKPKTFAVRSNPEGILIAIPSETYAPIQNWSSTGKKTGAEATTKKDTAVVAIDSAMNIEADVPPELAIYMRPETLSYKGITADMETIVVAQYIRNKVVYTGKGPDPFLTPSNEKKRELGKDILPSVEDMLVVGIVQIGGHNVALMQNSKGVGYVIAGGDSVESGICVEVSDTSAKFDLYDFGQVRKVEIPITRPDKRQQQQEER